MARKPNPIGQKMDEQVPTVETLLDGLVGTLSQEQVEALCKFWDFWEQSRFSVGHKRFFHIAGRVLGREGKDEE